MNIKSQIHLIEQLIIFEKIIINSTYGVQNRNPLLSYERVYKLKESLQSLKKLELRIDKIDKIKDNIYNKKIQKI